MLKIVLVGLHEARGDPLEIENKIKNRLLRFAAYKQFSHQVFYGKLDNITQKQMDNMFLIIKARKIYKNTIYTYITKLTLIQIIVYLALNLEICFSIIFFFSVLVMVQCFC